MYNIHIYIRVIARSRRGRNEGNSAVEKIPFEKARIPFGRIVT